MQENESRPGNQEFYHLEVWKKSRLLRNKAIMTADGFPNKEKYDLGDQVKRAARSVTACIAEGHGRFTYKDQVHFCIIARGSLSELLNHFIDAFDQHYIDKSTLVVLKQNIFEVHRLLNGYISYLKTKLDNNRKKG
ncbi:MAG: four helix bundle protein [Chitinophagaceae bacterium]|nr:MAG: four helix bundle protein [Chitinophagaceae bacterium]